MWHLTALPIIQAPMAGSQAGSLTVAVSNAGGLGSLPCAGLTLDQIRAELQHIRQATTRPYNMNFFCHAEPVRDAGREAAWLARLEPYYREFGIAPDRNEAPAGRRPFDAEALALLRELTPPVVSSDRARHTALTNVFTGRPARSIVNRLVRELGPISPDAPSFPLPTGPLWPLRAAAEALGSSDFTPLWPDRIPMAAATSRQGSWCVGWPPITGGASRRGAGPDRRSTAVDTGSRRGVALASRPKARMAFHCPTLPDCRHTIGHLPPTGPVTSG